MEWFNMMGVFEWEVIGFVAIGFFFSAIGICFLLAPQWLVALSAWSNRMLFLDYIPMVHRRKSAAVLFMTSFLMFWLAWRWH